MPSQYPLFDRSRLRLLPLAERRHDLVLDDLLLDLRPVPFAAPQLDAVADRMLRARERGAAVILMMGAHVLRSGVQRYLIDLIERGLLSCLATNGASAIHDFELALLGATTESVSRYVKTGQFGLWRETGRLNGIIREGAARGLGLGEAVGRAIWEGDFPHKEKSVFAAAWRQKIPITVHVGVGYDIIHEHPDCDGAALGETSYRDFLIYAKVMESLAHGVVLNFGSAVMAPEVFLKALAMVRNVAGQTGDRIGGFSTLVCDLQDLPEDCRAEAPKTDPRYYFRPWKTMLARTIEDGGESFYLRGRHAETLPGLWTALRARRG